MVPPPGAVPPSAVPTPAVTPPATGSTSPPPTAVSTAVPVTPSCARTHADGQLLGCEPRGSGPDRGNAHDARPERRQAHRHQAQRRHHLGHHLRSCPADRGDLHGCDDFRLELRRGDLGAHDAQPRPRLQLHVLVSATREPQPPSRPPRPPLRLPLLAWVPPRMTDSLGWMRT